VSFDNDIIDDFIQEQRMIEAAFAVPLAERKAEALRRFQAGERPRHSTGIDDLPTVGYGFLDDNGFWEFPLEVKP
jgi:hypothetical protein